MSEYTARVHWLRDQQENFIDNQYSRAHEWLFDGGASVPASSSPHVVPLPYSVESNVDPEEAFIAIAFQLSHAVLSFYRCKTKNYC